MENEEINPVALTEKNLTEANSTIAQRSLQEKGNDHGSPAIASGSSNLATGKEIILTPVPISPADRADNNPQAAQEQRKEKFHLKPPRAITADSQV